MISSLPSALPGEEGFEAKIVEKLGLAAWVDTSDGEGALALPDFGDDAACFTGEARGERAAGFTGEPAPTFARAAARCVPEGGMYGMAPRRTL
mmetsp:Transcript_109288/g.296386  ORF Transcript_109288/g.296386 Transcript_109288/m.296386 type:complete len:93 (-) Transcript_109288:6-284(-)